MRAIDYLKRIKELDDRINRNIRAAEKWRDMAFKITADPLEEHYNPNRPTSAPFEKCLEKVDELEREITADIDRLADLKFEASEKISMLKDEQCQDVLRYKYIELMDWPNVIYNIGKSRSHVYRLHSKALSELDKIL